MLKKILFISFLLSLTNCSAPGSALLGPTFTGVKTGSAYQTSMSYGSGKVINVLKKSFPEEMTKVEKLSLTNNFNSEIYKINFEYPPILLKIKTHFIEFSEPTIEEPLP